jgi:hypothetical protein
MAKFIKREEIKKALKAIPYLKETQRQYLHGILDAHKDFGGVDRFEFERTMRALHTDHKDQLSSFEVEKVREALHPLLSEHQEHDEHEEHDEEMPKAA